MLRNVFLVIMLFALLTMKEATPSPRLQHDPVAYDLLQTWDTDPNYMDPVEHRDPDTSMQPKGTNDKFTVVISYTIPLYVFYIPYRSHK